MEYINNIQEVKLLLADSDHSDVKTIEGRVSLREFIAYICFHMNLGGSGCSAMYAKLCLSGCLALKNRMKDFSGCGLKMYH